jgi:hypothetical protein
MSEPIPPRDGVDEGSSLPPDGAPLAPPTVWGPPDATQPIPMVPVLDAGRPRRSRATLIGALVGVTALVAAGVFAVVSIVGNDTAGGAASPAEVGTELTAALDNEDVLGVVDLLLPGERDTLRDPLIRTVDNLIRLEVLAADASLSAIAGVDIQFADVSVREEPTNVDDIVNIVLSGRASITFDGTTIPIGDLLIDEAFDGERPELPEPTSEQFDDVQLTVVERDGRWYLSAFYSIAEQARASVDSPDDIPVAGVEPAGADEPELAVDQMIDAISDQDLEALIAALDPTEFEALQRYAPMFLADAQAEIDNLDLSWSIDQRSYTVEGSGDRRTVDIDSFRFLLADPDPTLDDEGQGDVSVIYADDCLTVVFEGDETESCGVGEGDIGDLADEMDLGDDGTVNDLLETIGAAFDDYDPSGIGVHEVDGRWYVSPMSTAFDAVNDVLDALDVGELRDVIAAFKELGSEFEDYMADMPGLIDEGSGVDLGPLSPSADESASDARAGL